MQTTQSLLPLEQQVTAVVTSHPHLFQRRMSLRADCGHITLKGTVRSYFEKQLAQEVVRGVTGVQSVVNHLEVDWSDESCPD